MGKKIFRWFYKAALWFLFLSIGLVIVYRFVPVPVTFLMLQRYVEQAFDEKRTVRLKKDWVSLEEMSPQLPLAVIASEDQNFLEHEGLDFEAIEKAQQYNEKQKMRGKKKMRGASTISQQTAKNVFLWPGRSWIRKAFEVYFTFLIEIFWSKERIVEVYLNVIETGDGIYGAEGSSQYFFHKKASQLSSAECAAIAAVLPNPLKYSVSKPSAYILKRRAWIQRQMGNLGKLDFE